MFLVKTDLIMLSMMIVVNDEYYFRGSTSLPFRCTSSIWWRALITYCHYTKFLFSTDSCHLLKPRLKHFNCLFRFACHFLIKFFTYFTRLIFSFAVCKLHVWMCEMWMYCLYFMWMTVSKCIGAWVWCVVEVKFMGLWMEVFSDVQHTGRPQLGLGSEPVVAVEMYT